MDNFGESVRSSAGFRRRMQQPTIAGGSSAGMHRTERDPTVAPELICGCQLTVVVQTARTDKNWGRRFLSCTTCHLFIWEDLLNRYAEDMVFYCEAPVIDELKAELNLARQLLMQKDALIASLESELMKYSGTAHDVDRSTQQDAPSQVRSHYNWWKIILVCVCAAWVVKALVSVSLHADNGVLALE